MFVLATRIGRDGKYRGAIIYGKPNGTGVMVSPVLDAEWLAGFLRMTELGRQGVRKLRIENHFAR